MSPRVEETVGSEDKRASRNRKVDRRNPFGGQAGPIIIATILLFVMSLLLQPQSMTGGALRGMLPFAAVLVIVAIGQTLVIQQGGIDLSVPGAVSLAVVIVAIVPDGDDSKVLPAIALAYVVAFISGLGTGILVSRFAVTSIVATLGMNALLYAAVFAVSGGVPRSTASGLRSFMGADVLGLQTSVILAVAITLVVGFIVKRTVVGRRFEAVGANSATARVAGLRVVRHKTSAFVCASLLYSTAGIVLAGVISAPSAFQGDSYLLPSITAVVLGGTSLLGGRGSVLASATAALFLSQLSQVLITAGLSQPVANMITAAALATGVAVNQLGGRGSLARLFRGASNPRSSV